SSHYATSENQQRRVQPRPINLSIALTSAFVSRGPTDRVGWTPGGSVFAAARYASRTSSRLRRCPRRRSRLIAIGGAAGGEPHAPILFLVVVGVGAQLACGREIQRTNQVGEVGRRENLRQPNAALRQLRGDLRPSRQLARIIANVRAGVTAHLDGAARVKLGQV